jgi:hypothetical protein
VPVPAVKVVLPYLKKYWKRYKGIPSLRSETSLR